eukprot:3231087-Lingulodinium_polyedra.AAC.1
MRSCSGLAEQPSGIHGTTELGPPCSCDWSVLVFRAACVGSPGPSSRPTLAICPVGPSAGRAPLLLSFLVEVA